MLHRFMGLEIVNTGDPLTKWEGRRRRPGCGRAKRGRNQYCIHLCQCARSLGRGGARGDAGVREGRLVGRNWCQWAVVRGLG